MIRRAALAATLAIAGTIAAAAIYTTHSGADTEGCASHAEYDRLQTLMSPSSVAILLDTNGTYAPGGQNTFIRNYPSCWAPDDDRVSVWYDEDAGLSLRWDIRHA